jgi:hypothetical protein
MNSNIFYIKLLVIIIFLPLQMKIVKIMNLFHTKNIFVCGLLMFYNISTDAQNWIEVPARSSLNPVVTEKNVLPDFQMSNSLQQMNTPNFFDSFSKLLPFRQNNSRASQPFQNDYSHSMAKLQFGKIEIGLSKQNIYTSAFTPLQFNAIAGVNTGLLLQYQYEDIIKLHIGATSVYSPSPFVSHPDLRFDFASTFKISDRLYFVLRGGTPLFLSNYSIANDPYADMMYLNRNQTYIGAYLIYLLNDKWRIEGGVKMEYDIITKKHYLRPEFGFSRR